MYAACKALLRANCRYFSKCRNHFRKEKLFCEPSLSKPQKSLINYNFFGNNNDKSRVEE